MQAKMKLPPNSSTEKALQCKMLQGFLMLLIVFRHCL